MKKAWKWGLALAGVPALCIAVLGVDSYYRAVAAIRFEDERLARDIAAYRSAQKPRLPLSHESVEGLPCPQTRIGANPAGLEQGISEDRNHTLHLLIDLAGLPPSTSPPGPALTGDQLITALSVIHNAVRECGYGSVELGHYFEEFALRELRRTLAERGIKSSEIRKLGAALDRLHSLRTPLRDVQLAEHLRDRAEVLRVLHVKADPCGFIHEGPGWKEFFSWRILIVKSLNQLEDRYRRLRDLDSDAAREFALSVRHEHAFTRSSLCSQASEALESERLARCRWALARLAVEIALFTAERGREPASLDALAAPGLLVNPYNGEPFVYESGVLKTKPSTSGPQLEWKLRPE